MNSNILRVALCIIFFTFIQVLGYAQISENEHFLKKIGITDSLYSKTFNEYKTIYIQLPANYSPENSEKYPVVFILDGEILLPAVSNVQDFYSGGFTPEMVLVGVSNAHNRTRDLTTSKISEKYGMPFNEENGEAPQYSNFIKTELIPFIENKYPVTNFRTLIGHSYGGLFAIYVLLKQPELFSNYIAIDPSLDWDNQKLITEAGEKLAKNNFKGKSLFIALSGQLHMQNSKITLDNVMEDTTDYTLFARSNITFSNLVKQNASNGLAYNWKFYPKDLHGTIPFPATMDGLIATFEWYQMENTDKINSFDTPKETLFNIIKYREKKLKAHFGYAVPPYPEELLTMSGYMNLDMKQPEKAKMYFELAVEYYPNSANAYDSMAEYYEGINDFENALKLITKAYKINPSDYFKKRMESMKGR
ncbi:prolyl oligopeptidase family serine peptidase [Aequorivita sp. F47161]|uniref:Prolyl oligopeptidase family serine peptidase n=1 Tax=Aequorivita vitellina TaxID=2874475 RepID=A0A9X1U2T4_9FLAO|nr:alpha/beta hydrolase-fold protein [Aequorivita vitellina]MCG2418562.1 prolyl oligopeptidase family serine peptidase [Aequorivita vitellina]